MKIEELKNRNIAEEILCHTLSSIYKNGPVKSTDFETLSYISIFHPDLLEKENKGKSNQYIQSISLNNQEYKQAWINYADIMKGGQLKFIMGDKPVAWY